MHGGAVPVSGNLEEYAADRFLLCGDAAHHTNPLTGGGIMSGILGATIAAKWIEKGLKAGDLSRDFLRGYEQDCWDAVRQEPPQADAHPRLRGGPAPARSRPASTRLSRTWWRSNFAKPAMAMGYLRLLLLALANWKTTRKVFFSR